ncbi:MAG TPA: translocation/assembly module TamB domain-containing protein [Kofleriaceae bacterium]|nr:translocation/assembly module TamB domain-containing protein [Kofleriaceae bacterium]
MRSLLRWLRRIALTTLALVAIVAVAGLITAHTGCGRERLRRGIEDALRDAFPGGARLASLEGSLPGTLTLRGVELDGTDHRPLVTAGTVQVSVALWPLALQTARLDHVVAEDVHVIVRDRPPVEAGPPGPPSAWQVEIPALEVHRAAVEIDRSGLRLDGLDAAGAAWARDGRVDVSGAVRGRWSRAGRPAAELTAGGSIVLDDGVRIPGAIAVIDGATVIASALVIDLDHPAGSITVAAPAAVIAAQVPELDARLPGDVAATIGLAADGAATRLSVTAAAGEVRLWASLRGEPARRTARGLISATAIDLGAVTSGRLAGHGHLLAALDAGPGRARGALLAYGDLAIAGSPVRRGGVAIAGSLDGVTALALVSGDDALRAAAVARGHLETGAFQIDQARAVAAADGLTIPGQRITGALALDAALGEPFALGAPGRVIGVAVGRGVALAPDPAPAGAARLAVGAVRAPFALTLGGAGPITVAVRDAQASAVVRGDLAVDTARGSLAFHVAPAPGPDRGSEIRFDEAHLAATRIRRAATLLGDARVDVARQGAGYRVVANAQPPVAGLAIGTEAIVRRATGAYGAALGETRVRLPDGAAWTGRGGTLMIPDAPTAPIQLRDLTLGRGDATVALAGRFTPATGELTAHAGAERIDPASLGPASLGPAALGRDVLPPGTSGLGRATIDLARRGGQWQADAALAVAGLAVMPGATPVDASAHVVLGRRHATLDAHATSPALGDLRLALDVAAPGDPFDLAAWRRLDRSALHTAAITAHGVAVAGLAGALGPSAGAIGGTIDGSVDLAPSALRGELAVRGLALPGAMPGSGPGSAPGSTPGITIDGELTVTPVDSDLDARAAARLAGVAAAKLTARLAVPEHPFDPDTWRRGRELVREATATVDDVAFDPALLARFGGEALSALPLSGHLGARLAIGAAARDVQLAVQLSGVTGGRLVGPVSPRAELTAGPSGTHLHAELRAGPGPDGGGLRLGTLDGDVPMTVDRWRAEPAAVLRAPLAARWTLDPVALAPVLALLGRHELAAGTLEGNATIRGTVAAPVVPSAGLVARGLRFSPLLGDRAVPAVRELAVAATWGGATGTLEIRGSEAAGGELHATLNGRPDAPLAATGTARLTRLDVAPIAALLPGALASAAGVVDGELALAAGGRFTGHLHVAGGAVPLAAAIGTLRDATGELTSDVAGLHGKLHGRLGRGTIDVDADARPDLSQATATLALHGVSPIAALRPTINARLTAQLRREAGQLRASVTVEDGASIALPASGGTQLLDPTVPDDLLLPGAPARPRGPRVPAHPWLVVELHAPAIRFDAPDLGEGVALSGTLRSDPLQVSIGDTVGVTGKVAVESDDFELFGRRYVVEPARDGQSSLVFDGTLDPRVEIAMSHAFTDLTLHVEVAGRLSKFDLQFSSDPAGLYNHDQLFAFFLGGEPTADPVSATRGVAVGAVTGLGTRLISGEIGKQLNRLLPAPVKLDTLACAPDPAGITTTSGTCTVGKWLMQRVYLAYTQHLQPAPDENTGDAQVQIRLWRDILFQGTGGDRGYYGADLLWQRRW